ncbi:MAG: L,D-transpeptidase [candidate division Zixibacteria bacterium]|nr:L,D-transpeptidase [candidate division Zixibacteria bacterium]
MKKVFFFVIVPLVFLVGVLVVFMAITREKPPEGIKLALVDTVATNFPKDEKLARKELGNAEKSLLKLKPVKPYIVIDTHANRIYYRTEDSIYLDAVCSTGSGSELIDSVTKRKWVFNTPRGVFKIHNKIKDPWWRKPDWEFIANSEPIPKNESDRMDGNVMGDFAMGFGDGFFIHGTIYERLLGINVTHGCVRLGTEDLHKLVELTPIGTSVYIF